MTSLRPVLVLIAAVWFLQLGGGALSVIVPLGLSELGARSSEIGLIAAFYALGMVTGAILAPKLISSAGNIRVFSAAASLTLIGSIALSFSPPVWSWALVRILQGVGFAAMFISAEAWLGQAAPKEHRGSILGSYNVAAKAALMTGPFLVAGALGLFPYAFTLTALFFAMALIPVCLTQQVEPDRVQTVGFPLRDMARMAPAALAGCFMAGLINAGTFAFLPLYAATALSPMDATAAAASAFAAANAGGLIAQWPLGRLSDKIERRIVVGLQAFLTAGLVLALSLFGSDLPLWANLALLSGWGAGSLTFYGICVAHGIDRISEGRVTELMGVLIVCWSAGSVLGPLLAGLFIGDSVDGSRLFIFTSLGLACLGSIMMFRLARRGPVKRTTRWYPALPGPVGLISAPLHKFRKPKS